VSERSGREERDGLRIDRWLWCARFFRTRSMAAEAVKAGHVRIGGERVKAARDIVVGERIRIARGEEEFDITVLAIPQRRGPAAEANRLYVESEESAARRRLLLARRRDDALLQAPTPGRPDKRTRRLIRNRQRADFSPR
jgi:ribosome-associated heat shock protein Hsp15